MDGPIAPIAPEVDSVWDMSYLKRMEVHFTPELEKKLSELSTRTGRSADELVQDLISEDVHERSRVRDTLDSRYDEIKSGRVELIDGEAFFDGLRQREDELLNLQAL